MGQMFSKIVGSTFAGNHLLAELKAGDELALEQEPNNPYDSNAILVRSSSGAKLGHIPRKTAEIITGIMNENPVFCHVSEVTGGGVDMNLGCNIKLTW